MRNIVGRALDKVAEDVLSLETRGWDKQVLERLVAALGLSQIPSAQVIALFDLLRDGITPITPEMVTALLGVCEAHRRLLFTMAGCLEQRPAPAAKAEETEPEKAAEEADAQPEEAAPAPEAPAAPESEPSEGQPSRKRQAKSDAITSIRVGTDKLDRLIDLVGKLMVTFAVISQGKSTEKAAAGTLGELDAIIGQIKTEVDSIRLVPLKQIFIPMHRLVKSLTGKTGKHISLELSGEEVELDKMIVEELNEPLVHLLRNAVDHGLEAPEERERAGKDPTGVIRLSAALSGGVAEISVGDDGRGLDPERIEAKARKLGLLAPDEELDQEQACRLILSSGFSTAEKITDVSGRGVGMDAVASAVRERLKGEIDIASRLGRGCTFTLRLPLARNVNEGIVDALVVRCADMPLVLPSRLVREIFEPRASDMVELPDGREVVDVRGRSYPMIRLARLLGLPEDEGADRPLVVIISSGVHEAAFLTDEVLRQQQVVVAGFSIPLQDIYGIPITGYGMMGDSDALVVDTERLLEQAVRENGAEAEG